MKKNELGKYELRRILAIAENCRSFLYFGDFITDVENVKIYNRIKKYQDKNEIEIKDEELHNVEFKYIDRTDKKEENEVH